MLTILTRFLLIPLSLLLALAIPPAADAQQRPGTRPPRTRQQSQRRPARQQPKQEITVPINIGVGPSFNTLGAIDFGNLRLAGPVYDDQTFHYGLNISLYAVLDQQLLRENRRHIPRQYRSQVLRMDELRFKPAILSLIPTSLLISPKTNNTGVYGATWTLLGIGLSPISNPVRLGIDGNIVATYAYIYSDTIPSPTHFLRPGAEISLDLEIPITKQFLLSFGWASQFYIPQQIGGSLLETGSGNDALWHIGQAFLQLHFRAPYTTSF